MKAIQKLRNNLLTWRAVAVLGVRQYALYVASLLAHLPRVIHSGDLRAVDEAMGVNKVERFHYRDNNFLFDCGFCDEHIRDGSFAFGLARELYIRDCYFKYHPQAMIPSINTAMDLGANRGAFSVLLAKWAKFVICVEAQEFFVPVIQHNMQKNAYENYAIEVGFVGTGGALVKFDCPSLTIQELLDRYGLKQVDFIKMDIEGSEFALFRDADWLQDVNAISMEVHTSHGDSNIVLDALRRHRFNIVMADSNLTRVVDAKRLNFIYAWKDA